MYSCDGVYPALSANSGGGQNRAGVVCAVVPGVVTLEPDIAAREGGGKGAPVQEDKSATLATNNNQYLFQPVSIENHPADSRVDIDDSGKVQTLTSRMRPGGGNVPMVMEPVAFRKGTRPHNKDEAQKWEEADVANTLNTFDLGETRANELIIEEQPVICLQGNGIDRADTAGCNGKGWKENTSYTLNTIDRPAVAYSVEQKAECLDVGFFNSYEEQSPTLLARGYKDPHLVAYPHDAVRYIVRRLTPTECARLQGFADRWGDIDQKDIFTPEEYAFWHEVRNTHAAINGKKVQEYTEQQMLAWYNKLHTDSAEYKMWGNGIALPPALYCMQGISEVLNDSRH